MVRTCPRSLLQSYESRYAPHEQRDQGDDVQEQHSEHRDGLDGVCVHQTIVTQVLPFARAIADVRELLGVVYVVLNMRYDTNANHVPADDYDDYADEWERVYQEYDHAVQRDIETLGAAWRAGNAAKPAKRSWFRRNR